MSEKREASKRDQKNEPDAPPAKKPHIAASPDEEESLKALAEIQDKLQGIDDDCVKEQMQIQKKYDVKKAPLFEERQGVISRVANFWGKALLNHGALSTTVEEDKEFIRCLSCIDLEDNLDDAGSYKIKFVFSDEVKNRLEPLELVKHVVFSESNVAVVKFVTQIKFKDGPDPREVAIQKRKEGDSDGWSIFEWFSESDTVGEPGDEAPDLGEVIRRHFWHSPLSYYLNDVSDDEDDESYDEDDGEEEAS